MVYTKVLDKIPEGFIKANAKLKECYNNVFHFAMINSELFETENMRIAYGFMNDKNISEYLWFRHCFILDKKNNIIDITFLENDIPVQGNRYIIFKTFKNANQLLKIDNFLDNPTLAGHLLNEEKELLKQYVDIAQYKFIENSTFANDIVVFNLDKEKKEESRG